jgi:hypothetical protein
MSRTARDCCSHTSILSASIDSCTHEDGYTLTSSGAPVVFRIIASRNASMLAIRTLSISMSDMAINPNQVTPPSASFGDLGRPFEQMWLDAFSENFASRTRDKGMHFAQQEAPGLLYASGDTLTTRIAEGGTVAEGCTSTAEVVSALVNKEVLDGDLAFTSLEIRIFAVIPRSVRRSQRLNLRARLGDYKTDEAPKYLLATEKSAVQQAFEQQRDQPLPGREPFHHIGLGTVFGSHGRINEAFLGSILDQLEPGVSLGPIGEIRKS